MLPGLNVWGISYPANSFIHKYRSNWRQYPCTFLNRNLRSSWWCVNRPLPHNGDVYYLKDERYRIRDRGDPMYPETDGEVIEPGWWLQMLIHPLFHKGVSNTVSSYIRIGMPFLPGDSWMSTITTNLPWYWKRRGWRGHVRLLMDYAKPAVLCYIGKQRSIHFWERSILYTVIFRSRHKTLPQMPED